MGVERDRVRALKLWMSLRQHGAAKFGRLISQNAAQARYLVRLAAAADAAVAAGGVLPPAPPLDDDATAGATQRGRHQLNWQRAVRLAEDRFMR